MASEYPFRRIVGVEILPELERAQQENIRAFKSAAQQCTQIESVCADAREFQFPEEPVVLYLFNPLPEAALREVIGKLSLVRPLWILYHNPLHEELLAETGELIRTGGTEKYVVYRRR